MYIEERKRRTRARRRAYEVDSKLPRRHHDIHGDVAPGRRARRHQSLAGISRLRAAAHAWSNSSTEHMRTGRQPVRADGRACRRCAARSPPRCATTTARTSTPSREITVTSGATEALFCAIHASCAPATKSSCSIRPTTPTSPAIALAGGRARARAVAPARFLRRLASRARCDHVAHAPADRELAAQPQRCRLRAGRPRSAWPSCCAARGVLVLADEVYEHMVFDGRRHHSLLTHPELAERSFVVSSFGKTCHATGWKIGYCIAPGRR